MRYSYKCSECQYEFEVVLPIDCLATTEILCPVCCSNKIKKKYDLFGLIFKGEGFYKTDNDKTLTDKD